MISLRITELEEQIKALQSDAQKFDRGNNISGRRLRKSCISLIEQLNDIRSEILQTRYHRHDSVLRAGQNPEAYRNRRARILETGSTRLTTKQKLIVKENIKDEWEILPY